MIARYVAALAAAVWLTAVPGSSAAVVGPNAQPVAANFSLKDLNGKVRRLSDYRGKLVIVNFWATWCPPCEREIPSMERTYRKFKHRGLVILGIEEGEGWETVEPVAEQMKITYPVLLDRDESVSRRYKIIGLPTSYLIDPRGRIVDVLVGGRNWTNPGLRARLARLLPGPSRERAGLHAKPPRRP